MQIPRDTLLACQPEDAAEILYELGKALRGANLKKASWLLIAKGLRVQRISDILFQRLQAASTRQDALRVLRIARKNVRERKKGSGSARHRAPQENPLAVAAETSPEQYLDDEVMIQWEIDIDAEMDPQGEFEEWLAEQENLEPTERTRHPALLPVSRRQEAIDRYAWDRRSTGRATREDLRSRLDEETYQRLLEAANVSSAIELEEAELAFLRKHDLSQLIDYAANPQQTRTQEWIRDGFALAGLRMIADHIKPKAPPFPVDWQAVASWLEERLVSAHTPEHAQAVISSAYAFFRHAPVELVKQILQTSADWHPGWASLLWYAYQRIPELRPEQALPPNEPPGWWGNSGAYVNDIRWERLLDAGTGSSLVLHALRRNAADLLSPTDLVRPRYQSAAHRLLMAGGGTLRRMDYQSFKLVCRPSITLVRLETFIQLVDLAEDIVALHIKISTLNRSSLADWITRTFQTLSPEPLPDGLPPQIASTVERHAIAYLMLKERVLRETFQAAPFRLRRKHIQRFWDEQTEETLPSGIPADFKALREEFGDDAMHEALAHALLDHFKDDWGAVEPAAQPLKETLLLLLRATAIAYRLQIPWLSYDGEPTESDLERTPEIANFLIQQTENAPRELAQSLLIDPQQGLPRLAGGRLTPLEQECRRMVKAIAGVAQHRVRGGEARIFHCQPIPKNAALDRGSLGGDCSSDSVPMRSLSPHHTYYGIYENGAQQRGYVTVYEAWAAVLDEEGEEISERLPVLCLETINVPMRVFDATLQDLLVIFEAVAKSRGLVRGLVLITSLGTWNYQNGEILRQSRRARQGKPVRLFPADPALWNVYTLMAPEAMHYTAFFEDDTASRYRTAFRLLAPFDPDLDAVEPENLAEAQRIAELPPKRLQITARSEKGPAGFISELPELL